VGLACRRIDNTAVLDGYVENEEFLVELNGLEGFRGGKRVITSHIPLN
jgi:hypothetical protein